MRTKLLGKHFLSALAILPAALLFGWSGTPLYGEEHSLRVVSSSVTSEFPEGFRFRLEVAGESEISTIAVRFRTGQQAIGAYDYLAFEKGTLVDSELFWRTNTVARYIPPGTIITYNFEIEDAEGTNLNTEPQEFIYHDARFEWEEISKRAVSVAYHGPVRSRAEKILDAIILTMDNMVPVLGENIDDPIRVTMYNNVKEMLGALPPGSTTIRRELITEGQAFVDVGTLLVLGGGRAAEGTASHEVTHILSHRAGDGVLRNVPSWLGEGLSEFGNVVQGLSYSIALEFAIATDQLIPITSRRTRPSNPEQVIIFYGEARSLVGYMIGRYGAESMRQLMASMKSDRDIDAAMLDIYGLDRLGLENQWRDWIGAPQYSPPEVGSARPTPIPLPAVLPYSLTPQPSSVTIASAGSTPAPPTQQSEATTPEPRVTATAMPTATSVPLAIAVTAPPPDQGSVTATEQQASPVEETSGAETGGGSCGMPREGDQGPIDLSGLVLLVGVAGLRLHRRIRP